MFTTRTAPRCSHRTTVSSSHTYIIRALMYMSLRVLPCSYSRQLRGEQRRHVRCLQRLRRLGALRQQRRDADHLLRVTLRRPFGELPTGFAEVRHLRRPLRCQDADSAPPPPSLSPSEWRRVYILPSPTLARDPRPSMLCTSPLPALTLYRPSTAHLRPSAPPRRMQ